MTEEVAIKLLDICDKYLLSELKALCEDFLSRRITLVNYVNLSNLSEQFEANVLKNAVIKFVRQNLKKIKTSGEIADLSKAMLWDILFTYSEETESNKSPKSK